MADFKFVPDELGFCGMRNMPGIQKACLATAQAVASDASHGKYSFQTDVQPGKSRCHARVSWSPSLALAEMGKGAYYRNAKDDPAKKALRDAAIAHGGKGARG